MSIAPLRAALRRHSFAVACAGFALFSASLLGALARLSKALRRHSFSVLCTVLLLASSASLVGAPVGTALLLWAIASWLGLGIWAAVELFVLERFGCRPPSHLERERLDSVLGPVGVEVLVLDAAEPWLGRGLRSLVISRALLDLVEDRALVGLLTQAVAQVRGASLAGELVVWLGNVPWLVAWFVSRGLVHLARLLAVVVGASLVLPVALWPGGFVRWAGRLMGAAIVGLLGSALLSAGLSAAGIGLLLAWVIVPALQALLNWETRSSEAAADDATLDAGLGWQLVEALETLAWAASVPPPAGLFGWLCRVHTPFTTRADRIWRKLAQV